MSNIFNNLITKIKSKKSSINNNELDEYAFRNHLLGALLSDDNLGYDSINLNTLDKESWEKFFGENGTIRQTAKENYWDVKPFMSNDNFIKGINLALDKSLFTDMEYEGDVENPRHIINISECDYYKYDVELARKYFKVALEEMIEQAWEGVIEKSMDNSKSHVDSDLLENELKGELAKAIDSLDPKEKQVISLYYYENLNLREIGEVLDISQQRVSQIRKKALDKMYEEMKEYRYD